MAKVTDLNEHRLKKQDEYLERVMNAELLPYDVDKVKIEEAMKTFFGIENFY